MNLKSASQFNETFRRRLWHGLMAVLLAWFALVPQTPAQSNQPPATNLVSANRFLFIVETSAAIKPVAPHVLKAVGDLINTGANGQMRDGDTIGLWTFNQQVYSSLPVQTWAQSIRSQVADRTAAFMRRQPLEKSGQFDKVLPNLFGIIDASDFITVIIVSTGEGKMKGTPFDAEINTLYRQAIKSMKGQRMPVVTVLQAKGGKLLRNYTVNALPWPVIIPEVPILLRPVPVVAAQPTPKATPAAPAIVAPPPNLIVTGTAANPVSQPVASPPAPKTIIPQPVVQPQTTPPVVAEQTTTPPSVTSPPPVPAPAFTTTPPVEIAKIETAIVKPESSPPPPLVTPKPAKPLAPPPPAPAPAQTPPSVTTMPVAPAPATEPAPSPKALASEAAASSVPPALVPPQNPAPNSTELATAMGEPVQRSNSLLIASMVLVIIALALIFLMMLRNRSTSGPSLITHAIGNKKK
jgi:hypothetical protein